MRAARLHEWGEDPVVEDVPAPARRDGATTVAVEAAAVSHLDLTISGGQFRLRPQLPHTGGVEGCGRVVDSGTLAPGTRVLIRGAGVGIVKPGCWAGYVVAADKALRPVGDDLPAPLAATFFVPCTTAYVALHDVGGFTRGERVVVTGAAGAVGSVVTQLALQGGAAEVIAVVPREEQFGLVPEGARPVAGRGADVVAALGGKPAATLLVDTLGGDGLPELLGLVQPGGRAVLVGYALGPAITLDLPNWLLQEIRLLPVNMMRNEERANEIAPRLAAEVAAGTIRLAVELFGLEEIGAALARLRAGRLAGRGVVTPTAGDRAEP
jgi:NADPH:quinone reductase-like Zn-dependent oxidoreductase